MISVTIDRTSLSLADLVVTDSPTASLWIPEDGLGRPGLSRRNEYASDARFLHGTYLTSSTLEQSSLPVTIYAKESTSAALDTLQASLEAALGQFNYLTTVVVDGVTKAWSSDPASLSWGLVDSGMTRFKIARASVVIPVHPVPIPAEED